MKPFLNPSYPASDAASTDDRVWLEQHAWRRLRVRPFRDGELCQGIALFQADESGEAQEINYVIVRQVRPGWRERRPIYVTRAQAGGLNSDEKIEQFLRSCGIDPDAPSILPKKGEGK